MARGIQGRIPSGEHDGAALHVAVSAHVFRRRVENEVEPELDRALEDRCRERVVDEREGTRLAGDPRNGREVHDLQQRVGWRLGPDEPGVRADGAADRTGVGHVDDRRFEPPAREVLRGHLEELVVDVVGKDHVRAGRHRLKHRGPAGDSRGEDHRRLAAFKSGKGRLETVLRRIAVTDVNVAADLLGAGPELVVRRKMQRRGDRAGDRITVGAGVDRDRFDPHDRATEARTGSSLPLEEAVSSVAAVRYTGMHHCRYSGRRPRTTSK